MANKTEQLLQYLIDNWSKSFTLYELASVMDLTPSGVKYHMQKVVRKGLIDVFDAPKGTPFRFQYHRNTVPVFKEEPVTLVDELLKRIISLEKRVEELQYPQEISNKRNISISPDGTVHIS